MKLSLKEKKLLYVFACPNHHNTVTRLKLLTVLAVDPEAKHRTLELARKVETEIGENWHRAFYLHLRRENDRWFDVGNSEHIDSERVGRNVYWDCYRGFTTHAFRDNPDQPDYSFEEIERMYYSEHYGGHVEAQNARNEKTRHTERNRTIEDLLKNNKTCPEESIYQIGTMGQSVSPDTLGCIVQEFYEEFERRFGSHVHILESG